MKGQRNDKVFVARHSLTCYNNQWTLVRLCCVETARFAVSRTVVSPHPAQLRQHLK